MADLGLLAGLAQGLNQGLGNYVNTTQALQNQAIRNKQLQAQLLKEGLQDNPEGGLELTPIAKAQQDAQMQSLSSDSDTSKRAGLLSGQLASKFGLSVPEGMTAAESQELNKGLLSAMGRQVVSDRMSDRNAIMAGQFKERQNVNASNAGQAFEKDHIIQQTKKTNNSLDRAMSLINGKEPITSKSFNILQQDFINAMAPGGAATEGKVNRELVETAAAKLNELKLKFGDVSDLRSSQPQVVDNLRNLINQVKQDYSKSQAQQAKDIYDSFSESNNPQVKKTIKTKLDRYAPAGLLEAESSISPEDQQALDWANANPKDSRAAAIKQKLGR